MATLKGGRDEVVKLIGAGLSGNQFGSVGVGTSSTANTQGMTRLQDTLDTHTGLTASQNGNTMTLVGTFTGNSASVRESTVFENTGSVTLARQVISTINVQSSDTLEVTWDVNVSDT